MPSIEAADALICAVLGGTPPPWPAGADSAYADTILDRINYHGVYAMMHEGLGRDSDWPAPLRSKLREQSIANAMYELRHGELVARLIGALEADAIPHVLIKGTALAYAVYPNPVLRPRADTDLLVRERDKARAGDCLRRIGFTCRDINLGKRFIGQLVFHSEAGARHDIDLHWRLSNSQFLARALSFDELFARAVSAPRLHDKAKVLGPADALLIASMHRADNGSTSDRLVWLIDVALMGRKFGASDWNQLVSLAISKGFCSVCHETLVLAQARLGAPCPDAVLEQLRCHASTEAMPRYLSATPLERRWMDFSALEGGAPKLAYVRELLFPPKAYMLGKYSRTPNATLSSLHLRRLAGGLAKGLRLATRLRP